MMHITGLTISIVFNIMDEHVTSMLQLKSCSKKYLEMINNSMFAKAEIPFLIFEKNRGKCFIEQY